MSDEEAKDTTSRLYERTKDDPLWSYRGLAIDAYSRLEHALCRVVQHMLGTSSKRAGIIFFKTTSASARAAIIEKLIQDNFGNRFNLFWNSFFKQTRPIDIERNEIVHWSAIYSFQKERMILCPPNFWTAMSDSPYKTKEDLNIFIQKCETYSKLAHNFATTLSSEHQHLIQRDKLESLLQIFQQPIIYPLPKDHPLALIV